MAIPTTQVERGVCPVELKQGQDPVQRLIVKFVDLDQRVAMRLQAVSSKRWAFLHRSV